MSFDWIIVSSEGFDVEDVLDARSVTDTCPACEKRVRLLERELTKNFKVFKISLLAVERGARVFQCPHCGACFEPPPVEPAAVVAEPAARSPEVEEKIKSLRENETRADDEVSLWRLRVELARKRGEHELARDAQAMVSRMEDGLRALRAQIATLEGRAPVEATEAIAEPGEAKVEAVVVPKPPPPPEKAPEPTVREVDDEMAALKRKLRGGGAEGPSATGAGSAGSASEVAEDAVNAPPGDAPVQPPPSDGGDEMADLKKLLRKRD